MTYRPPRDWVNEGYGPEDMYENEEPALTPEQIDELIAEGERREADEREGKRLIPLSHDEDGAVTEWGYPEEAGGEQG